jgi:hypothetical protein
MELIIIFRWQLSAIMGGSFHNNMHELGITKPNGVIETFFRLKKGYDYYLRQIEKYGK